ncbi:rolling circle replication-associated protein [Acinetobacter pseudolwoffii]|uniref:rolling circle replication-associated protein n=1 Tax=Acinetobacter pseudolwoffii TaxID=2053287 RepID=UPI002574E919|nr:hypothetical protein [Acinetobacter pseudolwoffii]MDM1325433.1 hypothetical protein [Acinetobacter pseudolwoffii]
MYGQNKESGREERGAKAGIYHASTLSMANSLDLQKKSELRDTGLVSILTSDTDYKLQLPCPEYLRLKRLQKSVRISAQVIQDTLQQSRVKYKAHMVTLTYRDDVDWSPRQVSNYLKCVREWARRKGIFLHYVWVLELTKRGRPHYHVLFWLPRGISMPKADKQGWWRHGMTNTVPARSPVGYLCKYTSKGIDFDSWGKLPRGGRLYGHGGYSPSMRITRAWLIAPAWVRELIDQIDGVKKVGCYWVNRVSGMGIRSPFVFDFNDRTLRFKGFDAPIHIDDIEIEKVKKDDPDWYRVRFLESVDAVSFGGYYDAIDAGFDAVSSMTT